VVFIHGRKSGQTKRDSCRRPIHDSNLFARAGPAGRVLPLGHLRTALSGRHAQLRRPPGDQLPQPTLQQEFGWSEMDYADIVFAFQVACAIGLILAGG
jgi:hypothetical protein